MDLEDYITHEYFRYTECVCCSLTGVSMVPLIWGFCQILSDLDQPKERWELLKKQSLRMLAVLLWPTFFIFDTLYICINLC